MDLSMIVGAPPGIQGMGINKTGSQFNPAMMQQSSGTDMGSSHMDQGDQKGPWDMNALGAAIMGMTESIMALGKGKGKGKGT